MQINKQKLLNVLEEVKPGLAAKEILEQSNTFGFIKGKIATYNDSVSVQSPIDLDIEGAVDANKFYAIINKMKPNKEGCIDISTEDDQIIVSSKKSKAGLALQTECKLPLEEINLDGKWKKLPDNFLEGLKVCLPCVSNDFSRPIITCISIDNEDILAGDGKRLIKYKLNKTIRLKIAIPAQAVSHLIKYNVTHYLVDNEWGHFKTQNTIFSCRVLNENYPDIHHLFEIQGEEIKFPDKLIDGISRAEVFAKTDISEDDLVQITIQNGKLLIRGEDGTGWYKEEMKIKSSIEASFYTNPKFLINILPTLKECVICEEKGLIKFSSDNWEHVISIQTAEPTEE